MQKATENWSENPLISRWQKNLATFESFTDKSRVLKSPIVVNYGLKDSVTPRLRGAFFSATFIASRESTPARRNKTTGVGL